MRSYKAHKGLPFYKEQRFHVLRSPRCHFLLFVSGLMIGCLMMSGCQRGMKDLSTEYGKINGIEGGVSINGTSVFADMFSVRGFRVKHRSKISPRINRYQTLVWFPDSRSCPDPKVTQAIDAWLDEGYDRTFIYVGRDYNARADYLNDVMQRAPLAEQEELLRRLAETDLDHDTTWDDQFWWKDDLDSCDWFDRVDGLRSKSDQLSGSLTDNVNKSTEIELSDMLVPTSDSTWKSEPLVVAGEEEFAFKLSRPWEEYSECKIIVVSNGSFLVNYALVDPENRKLAGNLIDSCDPVGDVMFLESGRGGIKVSDSDTNNHNRWSWVSQAPLRYIVPHFLMWGILFCFVFFPIFGRPRVLKPKSTSTFRNHVNALGKMMGRTDLPNRAINKIHRYQELIGDSTRKKDK